MRLGKSNIPPEKWALLTSKQKDAIRHIAKLLVQRQLLEIVDSFIYINKEKI